MRYSAYRKQRPSYTTTAEGRDLDLLLFHQRYELVPSNYLYHFRGPYLSTRDYLTDLRKGTYIGFPDVPVEERLYRLPRNKFYPTTLKPRGEKIVGKPRRDNDQLPHKLLRCQVEILLDHGPLAVKLPEDILAHPNCPPETRKARSPFSIPLKPALRPDITRGFTNGDQTIFVHIEVDRATERMSEREDGSSIEDKIKRYVEYLRTEMYHTHFGFSVSVPPSIVFLTTRQNTDTLKALVKEHAEGFYDRFYWLSIPKNPLPTHDLFVPWQGVNGTLNLKELLPNVRQGQGGAHQDASE